LAARTVGLLHPGEMGAAVGAALVQAGHTVWWASAARSERSAERAAAAGLLDAGSIDELSRQAEVILSVCPPHAATEVAGAVAGFRGLFVDSNAISPQTARAIGATIEDAGGRYVDGGIIGPAPHRAGSTRLYLSGADAAEAAALFDGTIVEARVVSDEPGTASATKMVYAAWTKGTVALLLALRAAARAEGVEEVLLEEWRLSQPELLERSERAARAASERGWRWVGEMEEIAATFSAHGLPPGFHEAAAAVFASVPRLDGDEAVLERVLSELAPRSVPEG
jgi:3-hydroxyisobutyrate dehydrogenase-like beta-hydroxyacid dehydrogenase